MNTSRAPSASPGTLISEEYRALQTKLHEDQPAYGMKSVAYAPHVSAFVNKTHVRELLDYGAGKGRLAKNLKLGHDCKVIAYDPAVPEIAERPEPAEMVACIDVLEHIEPDKLEAVLEDLHRCTRRVLFLTVDCCPAVKTLADGRNAHLIQKPPDWWLGELTKWFDWRMIQRVPRGFWGLFEPKGDSE